MPRLKKLNILGNKFTKEIKPIINGLKMNHIHVSYLTQAERNKERMEEIKKIKKEEAVYYLLTKFKNKSLKNYLNY